MSLKFGPTAHELFETRAAAQPDSVALLYRDQSITYSELNRRANRLAHVLIRRGVRPEIFVGVYLEPSIEAIVAIFAILKAGGAYVPLESSHPPAALAAVMKQAGLPLVLTNSDLARRLPESTAAAICLDLLAAELDAESTANPKSAATSESPAVAVFTSGSTGEPKGVAWLHCSIPIRLRWCVFGPEEVYAFNRPLSVAASIHRIFQPLLGGAPLVIVPADIVTDIASFIALLETHKVTNFSIVPSHLRALLDAGKHIVERLARVKMLTVGGSRLPPDLIPRFTALLPGVTLFTQYSASEMGPCLQGVASAGAPTSGFPVEGCTVYIVDPQMQPVQDDVTGEILVESPWLPRGYLDLPDLTVERFIPNPCHPTSGRRCFRTGDLGRRLPDGSIEVLGRADDKVKIRGFLVDPADVESALREHSGILEAAVIAAEMGREMRLVAYIVPDHRGVVSSRLLRRFLAERIPDHKIPSAFVPLDRLPLTTSGKLDRRSLPNPSSIAANEAETQSADPPRTFSEIQMAQIWEEVFEFGPISRSAHFFDLGGDSLTAMVVAARVHAKCGVELNMRAFTTYPALIELAAEVDRLRVSPELHQIPPITPIPPEEPCPLSFAQESIWNHVRNSPKGANDFVKTRGYRLSGPLNIGALEAALHWVAMRHDILRTTFSDTDGKAVQIVSGSAPKCLPFDDVSSFPDPKARATEILVEESGHPIDITVGPLIRHRLVKIGPSEYWLFSAHHQILCDAWSSTRYVVELGEAYEAFAADSPPPSTPRGLQYRDYAAWERRVLAPGAPLRARLTEWWRQQAANRPPDGPLPMQRRFRFSKPRVSDARLRRNLDPELISRIEAFSTAERATYFAIGLALFAALLAAIKRHPSVTVGVYVSNRWRPEMQGVLGNFTSLVPVCLYCDHALPFREWLRSVQETLINVQAYAQLPVTQFGPDLQAGGIRPPEVHAIVVGPAAPDRHIPFGPLEFACVVHAPPPTMPWGLSIGLGSFEERPPHILVEFDAHKYDAAKVCRLFERFYRLLDSVTRNSASSLAALLNRC